MSEGLAYRRILLKLSGEALGRADRAGIDAAALDFAAGELAGLVRAGAAVGVVTGAGNILRGATLADTPVARAVADEMGMLATVINGLALAGSLKSKGIGVQLFSALPCGHTAGQYRRLDALGALKRGEIALLAGGTGNPFFTTDTAGALRAAELEAQILLKGTKVDGVYDGDPKAGGGAKRLPRLNYEEFLARRFRVMDQTAITLCREQKIPVMVFDFFTPGNLLRAARGEPVGSVIAD